jgi:hypothetical protein
MRRIASLAVVLLLAALPLRAVAAVTAGICLAGSDSATVQVSSHGNGAHGSDAQPAKDPSGQLGHDCGFCGKHCTGAAYAVPSVAAPIATGAPEDPIPFGARPIIGFVPNQLERPPLAP